MLAKTANLVPFQEQENDLIAELLADKRSVNTQRAYATDLKDFFEWATGQPATPDLLAQFLQLEREQAIRLVLQYKGQLIGKGLSEATTNRRLAALKSLVKYAQKVGRCNWSLEEIAGERYQAYRDTSGVDLEDFKRLLEVPDRQTLAGKRNYAILRLLWDNALRRSEVTKLNVDDFELNPQRLRILGKGRGTQAEWVQLSPGTTQAIAQWLEPRGRLAADSALFIALDNVHFGHRLTGDAIYQIVRALASQAGIARIFSPHRCRHSAITAALTFTNGNVREVQKLSRHKKLETLMIYDDARSGVQGKITNLLGELIDE